MSVYGKVTSVTLGNREFEKGDKLVINYSGNESVRGKIISAPAFSTEVLVRLENGCTIWFDTKTQRNCIREHIPAVRSSVPQYLEVKSEYQGTYT